MATLYRNLVKERLFVRDTDTLHVMLKGGDWAFGSQLVDGALGARIAASTKHQTNPTHRAVVCPQRFEK